MDPPAAGRSRHVCSSGSLLLSEAHAEPLSSQHSSVALKPWLLPRRPVNVPLPPGTRSPCAGAHTQPGESVVSEPREGASLQAVNGFAGFCNPFVTLEFYLRPFGPCSPQTPSVRGASVLHFLHQVLGRVWGVWGPQGPMGVAVFSELPGRAPPEPPWKPSPTHLRSLRLRPPRQPPQAHPSLEGPLPHITANPPPQERDGPWLETRDSSKPRILVAGSLQTWRG